jgi:hypothetical protein
MNRKDAWKLVEDNGPRLYTGATFTLLRLILKAATVRVDKTIDNDANVERTITLSLDSLKKHCRSESTFYFAMGKLDQDGVLRDRQTIEHNRKRPQVRLTLCLDKLKELEDLPTQREKLQDRTAKATATRIKQREDAKKARLGLLNCLAGCCPTRQALEQATA